jgi:outer membrane protein assembly factor BamB
MCFLFSFATLEASSPGILKWRMKIGEARESDARTLLSAAGNLRFKYGTGEDINWTMVPAIGSDGTIYFGSQDNHLYAVNPDGTLQWKFETGSDVDSPPAVGTDGTIYFGSLDKFIYALNPDGSLRWKYQTGAEILSAPAIDSTGNIYIGSADKSLYALNPDGILKWRFYTGDAIISSPAVSKSRTIYFGSADNYLYALNPQGTLKWRYQTEGSINSSPAIGLDGSIYFGSLDSYLYALNPDGTLQWKYKTGDMIISSPAIGITGTIYFGSFDKYLYALNPDGTLGWRYLTGNCIWSSPAIGSEGTSYFCSENLNVNPSNSLFALDISGALQWEYQAADLLISSPAIGSDGTIYFGAKDGSLYAVESGSTQGLALSFWPKRGQDQKNTGQEKKVKLLSESQVSVAFIPEYSGVEVLSADSAALPGDGTGRLTQPPKCLAPRMNLFLILANSDLATQDFTTYLTCTDANAYDRGCPGSRMAGEREIKLVDGSYQSPAMILQGGGSDERKSVLNGPVDASGVNYAVEVAFTGLSYANAPQAPLYYYLDAGGYTGANIDLHTSRWCGENARPGTAPSNIAFTKSGQFKVTWKDAGGGNLTVDVVDLVRGGSFPHVDFVDEIGWGFQPVEDFGGSSLTESGNLGNYINEAFVQKLPKAERQYKMLDKLPANRTTEFGFWIDGLCFVVSEEGGLTLPAPGTVWTVTVAFGSWNGDKTVFTQYPNLPSVGDKWKIDVKIMKENEAEPPLPADVTVDSRIDIFDILLIVRFALGQKTPTAQERTLADLNSDGKIDILDVLACVDKALGAPGKTLLAGYSGSNVSRIDEKELKANLLSLGADQALIRDVFKLLAQYAPNLPKAFSLGQNAPNPFNPSTTISYSVPEGPAVQVSLKVYDLRGRLVHNLVDEMREAGSYSVLWDGRDGKGRRVSSGVYLYRIEAGGFVETRKMILLK